MRSTAPPGRPKMRSTPSRFNGSSKIRAPDSFTACPPFRFLRVPPALREFSAPLEEAGRGQALRDLVEGDAVELSHRARFRALDARCLMRAWAEASHAMGTM